MAKPGRNDPCPCGSGKKYKACCLTRDTDTEREKLVAAQAARDDAERRQHAREMKAEFIARLRGDAADTGEDELDAASNAVVDLVKAGKLDEAEAAARELLARYPEVHDGWDRLGMVHEARGNNREAADCYRKVLDFLRKHPDYTDDDGLTTHYTGLVANLDPPSAT